MRRPILGPVTLVIIGTLLLLNNFGVLPWTIWQQLWRFWPLFLVIAGLNIAFFNHRGWTAVFGLWVPLAVLLVVIALASAPSGLAPGGSPPWGRLAAMVVESQPSDAEAAKAGITVEIGSGEARISRGGTGLFRSELNYDEQRGPFTLDRSVRDGRVELVYRRPSSFGPSPLWNREKHHITLGGVPMDLAVQLGSGEIRFAAEHILLTNVEMQVGSGQILAESETVNEAVCRQLRLEAGSGELSFSGFGLLNTSDVFVAVGSGKAYLQAGSLKKDCRIVVQVGSGRVRVVLPSGTAYQVRPQISSGYLLINGVRYSREQLIENSRIQSEGFGQAGASVEIVLTIGSGMVEIDTRD